MDLWELIVVDDHSDEEDATEEVVRSFGDSRIRYYRLPDHHGRNSACARNFGNALSRASFIAVADSDDIFYSHRLELTMAAFDAQDCDVFYSDFDVWNEDTNSYVDMNRFPAAPCELEVLKRYDMVPHGSLAYRRELSLRYPYNSFMTRSGDYDLITRLAEARMKFHFCPVKTYCYRLHTGNLLKSFDTMQFDQFLKQSRGWQPFDPSLAHELVAAFSSRAEKRERDGDL
jgi:glycosyltransferase involved in cell wall biosynthesis